MLPATAASWSKSQFRRRRPWSRSGKMHVLPSQTVRQPSAGPPRTMSLAPNPRRPRPMTPAHPAPRRLRRRPHRRQPWHRRPQPLLHHCRLQPLRQRRPRGEPLRRCHPSHPASRRPLARTLQRPRPPHYRTSRPPLPRPFLLHLAHRRRLRLPVLLHLPHQHQQRPRRQFRPQHQLLPRRLLRPRRRQPRRNRPPLATLAFFWLAASRTGTINGRLKLSSSGSLPARCWKGRSSAQG
jgi:hypothetical protein